MAQLQVERVPAFSDNYIYLLRDEAAGKTAVVDPGEAGPVEDALAARGWSLDQILITHHHDDHIGGLLPLKQRFGATVTGAAADAHRIPGLDRLVRAGDRIAVGGAEAEVFETPGHTLGHISLYFAGDRLLFCGDTLFALGCGRLFEGTAAQMWHSLTLLRALPDDTKIHCGHEYTQSNARFALTIEQDNQALKAYAARIDALRADKQPTIPALLGLEKQTSPFLRADVPSVQAALGMSGADPAAVFAEIRGRKDRF